MESQKVECEIERVHSSTRAYGSGFMMLSSNLYSIFTQYLLGARCRAPPASCLQELAPTFQDGAKTDRRALQSKFKSWAKRMMLAKGKLVMSTNGKLIVPSDCCTMIIKNLHFRDPHAHMGIDEMISEIQSVYTWNRKNFGMDYNIVSSTTLDLCQEQACVHDIQVKTYKPSAFGGSETPDATLLRALKSSQLLLSSESQNSLVPFPIPDISHLIPYHRLLKSRKPTQETKPLLRLPISDKVEFLKQLRLTPVQPQLIQPEEESSTKPFDVDEFIVNDRESEDGEESPTEELVIDQREEDTMEAGDETSTYVDTESNTQETTQKFNVNWDFNMDPDEAGESENTSFFDSLPKEQEPVKEATSETTKNVVPHTMKHQKRHRYPVPTTIAEVDNILEGIFKDAVNKRQINQARAAQVASQRSVMNLLRPTSRVTSRNLLHRSQGLIRHTADRMRRIEPINKRIMPRLQRMPKLQRIPLVASTISKPRVKSMFFKKRLLMNYQMEMASQAKRVKLEKAGEMNMTQSDSLEVEVDASNDQSMVDEQNDGDESVWETEYASYYDNASSVESTTNLPTSRPANQYFSSGCDLSLPEDTGKKPHAKPKRISPKKKEKPVPNYFSDENSLEERMEVIKNIINTMEPLLLHCGSGMDKGKHTDLLFQKIDIAQKLVQETKRDLELQRQLPDHYYDELYEDLE